MDRLECCLLARKVYAGKVRRQRFDFQAVHTNDGMSVVEQMMCQGEAGRAHAGDQSTWAAWRSRNRPVGIERIPSCQQRVDFKSPRQLENVFERARLRLR